MVRCAQCSHTWHQSPPPGTFPLPAEPEAPPPSVLPPHPAPEHVAAEAPAAEGERGEERIQLPAVPRRRRGSSWVTIGWIVLLLLVAGGAAAGVWWRDDIVRRWRGIIELHQLELAPTGKHHASHEGLPGRMPVAYRNDLATLELAWQSADASFEFRRFQPGTRLVGTRCRPRTARSINHAQFDGLFCWRCDRVRRDRAWLWRGDDPDQRDDPTIPS
jgi:hypothetical protein